VCQRFVGGAFIACDSRIALRNSDYYPHIVRRDGKDLEFLNGVLQLIGIAFIITFGVFAILAWESANGS
jgi:hypothetical protein